MAGPPGALPPPEQGLLPLATTMQCARHPAVPAVDVCQRCGTFTCGDCLELSIDAVLCTDCHRRQGASRFASRRAIASLILGLLGLPCGLVPGVIGLVLAYHELGRIDRGLSPEVGRGAARTGKILGWIDTGLLVLILLIGLVMRFLRS